MGAVAAGHCEHPWVQNKLSLRGGSFSLELHLVVCGDLRENIWKGLKQVMNSTRLSSWPGRIHGDVAVPVPLPAPAWLCPPAPRQLPSLAPFFTLTTKLHRDSACFLHHPFDRILLAGDKTLSCAHFTGNQSLLFSFFFLSQTLLHLQESNKS